MPSIFFKFVIWIFGTVDERFVRFYQKYGTSKDEASHDGKFCTRKTAVRSFSVLPCRAPVHCRFRGLLCSQLEVVPTSSRVLILIDAIEAYLYRCLRFWMHSYKALLAQGGGTGYRVL